MGYKRNYIAYKGFCVGSNSKERAFNARDLGLIPGWGRSPGEGNGYPLQYSCLETSMDRGAWQAIYGIEESGITNAYLFKEPLDEGERR